MFFSFSRLSGLSRKSTAPILTARSTSAWVAAAAISTTGVSSKASTNERPTASSAATTLACGVSGSGWGVWGVDGGPGGWCKGHARRATRQHESDTRWRRRPRRGWPQSAPSRGAAAATARGCSREPHLGQDDVKGGNPRPQEGEGLARAGQRGHCTGRDWTRWGRRGRVMGSRRAAGDDRGRRRAPPPRLTAVAQLGALHLADDAPQRRLIVIQQQDAQTLQHKALLGRGLLGEPRAFRGRKKACKHVQGALRTLGKLEDMLSAFPKLDPSVKEQNTAGCASSAAAPGTTGRGTPGGALQVRRAACAAPPK